jgi:hypothetical protein
LTHPGDGASKASNPNVIFMIAEEGERFFGEAQVNNNLSPVFARLTVAGKTNGVLNDVESGHEFVARTPEVSVKPMH